MVLHYKEGSHTLFSLTSLYNVKLINYQFTFNFIKRILVLKNQVKGYPTVWFLFLLNV